MRREHLIGLVALAVAAVVWGVVALSTQPSGGKSSPSARPSTSVTSGTVRSSASAPTGIPDCPLSSLPKQVKDAVALVRADGPYLRPRNDGGTFGNNERLLPSRPNGYYKEYTVSDPTSSFPGPRRLVTGGQVGGGSEPTEWFYTADHYVRFCRVQGT